jgi:AraC family transcriptional regulator
MAIRTATLHEYGRRVSRAIAHLMANLDRTPSLEELAAVAAFSPYHFHRVYRALAGETPAETLARERLSRAASDLLRSSLPLDRIARRAGYGSAAAFSRAFRAAHGVPPGVYRARRGIGAPTASSTLEENAIMHQVTIREEPALRLAVIPHIGPYTAIGAVFDRLTAWATSRGLVEEQTRYIGLFLDDPETVPATSLRSEAGLTVPDSVVAENDIAIRAIPAQRCAVLRFRGPYAELEGAYGWLYGTWLPASGEEPADAPPLEDYLNDPRSLPPAEWLTDIIVPLKLR